MHEQIVVDELHLMLRIMDVLMRNLVRFAVAEDTSNILHTTTIHVELLEEKIKACGVTFRVSSGLHAHVHACI